jgi:ribonuclease D
MHLNQSSVCGLSFSLALRFIQRVIDNARALQSLLPKLSGASWIALDTEADSLHAYPEKLCLLQISLPNEDLLIDPLAALNLRPLFEVLQQTELILHGADYDLRLLLRTFNSLPRSIFDTMLAARLLGYREFGLRDLVMRHLGVKLEKGPQKMNWAVRPLTQQMITYAINDTRYLHPLASALKTELKSHGRLSWHNETCAKLLADCARTRPVDPDDLWRVKGSDRLDPRGLAILRALWHWREHEAIASNKPPYFILSHEKLVDFSEAAAHNRPLDHLLPRHFSTKRASTLISEISRALQIPAGKYPQRRRSVIRRATTAQLTRFEQLKQLRDRRAAELALDPTLIASKADLLLVAKDSDCSSKELMNWQRKILDLPLD